MEPQLNSNKAFQHKLQVIQNKVVRFILNKGPRDHIGNAKLKKVGIINSKDRVTLLEYFTWCM